MTETAIRERPILFSGPMIRAILDGRKTMTRRTVFGDGQDEHHMPWKTPSGWQDGDERLRCPWNVGGRMWVREGWRITSINHGSPSQFWTVQFRDYAVLPHPLPPRDLFAPLTTRDEFEPTVSGLSFGRWRPSIHMPRWASRVMLEITGVKVERLNKISMKDAEAEGVEWNRGPTRDGHTNPVSAFRSLWDSINGKRGGCSCADNPWVFVISFRRISDAVA